MAASPPTLQQWLSRAYAAQRAGRMAEAEDGYRQVLSRHPDEPDALQLLGLLLKRRGADAEAEACWRRSLAARPQQPHVLNNLANLVARAGRVDEALDLLRQAIGQDDRLADAHYNRARLLRLRGEPEAAAAALDAAIARSPQPTAGMHHLQSQLLSDQGRLAQALTALDQALALSPTLAAAHHDRGVLLHRLGHDAQALTAHDCAAELGVDDADAHYNRGNVLQALGRMPDAVRAYRQALVRQPLHGLALYDLARLLWRLGDPAPDADLLAAQRQHPRDATAFSIRGHLLWRAGRVAEAAVDHAQAMAIEPRNARHVDALARCRVRLGEVGEGLDLHRRALELQPDHPEWLIHLGASLLEAGDATAAEPVLGRARQLAPDDQHALALLALCWRAQGDPRGDTLEDPALVAVDQLDIPTGWPSLEAFLGALAAELDGLHRDRQAPVDQTLRQGTQTTGTLFQQGHAHVAVLQGLLGAAIDRHLARLSQDPAHPFLNRLGPGWRFTDSWSSRLRHTGFHVDHVHPHGWLSGVVYIRLPADVSDVQRQAGWLRFGQPDFDVHRLAVPASRLPAVRPRPGQVVLFPSALWHGTTPFTGDDDRLTVAFDVLPQA